MVKVETRVNLQIEETDIQKIYSGKYKKIEDTDPGTPQGQIRIYKGAVIEISNEVHKRLGMSVKRYTTPINETKFSELTEDQISALESLETQKMEILGIEEETEVLEVTENPTKTKNKAKIDLSTPKARLPARN